MFLVAHNEIPAGEEIFVEYYGFDYWEWFYKKLGKK